MKNPLEQNQKNYLCLTKFAVKLIIQIKHAPYYVLFWIHTRFQWKKF